MGLRYLTQKLAAELDAELMAKDGVGYTLEQLMELAGLSVAQAINSKYSNDIYNRPLICCGPGNNGGDGLVSARHLSMFGYQPTVHYPKAGKSAIFAGLVQQCRSLHIPILDTSLSQEILHEHDFIVDAIFGFGFTGEVREPFISILASLHACRLPIVSIDVPSGWDVEKGNVMCTRSPEMLISLSAPKLCAKHFLGKYHVLGGRFIPPDIATRFELNLPAFQNGKQYIDL